MILDFAPDLPNESINFTFEWRGYLVLFHSLRNLFLALISSLMFSGRRRCGVFIDLVEVEAEVAFETLLCRRYGPIAQNISVCVCPAWVPGGMIGIKIAEKKGFVAMVENCIEFRRINGAVWRSINACHSNLTVVSPI
ncbi:hypothetical protein TNCV_4250631 [Trichonephila clavipes]|nr:hypothetical protein TNCV_4250631 [Trichonephila clavipes]